MKQVEKKLIDGIAYAIANQKDIQVNPYISIHAGYFKGLRTMIEVYLYDYLIASYNTVQRQLYITNNGMNTDIVKSRLNAILEAFGVPNRIKTIDKKHNIKNELGKFTTFYSATFNDVEL